MRFLVFIINIIIIRAAVLKKDCNGTIIDDVYYEKEILKEDIDRPYMLAVDFNTNVVYFSYSLNKEDDLFKSAYVDLDTKEFADIEGVNNGFAQAIDQKTHDVYIGGSNSIYNYDHKTKRVEEIIKDDIDIWNMFFKDVLYYSVFPSQFLYTLSNNEMVRFKELEETKVDQFAIDGDDVMFYSNATGFYGQKKGSNYAVLYKELTHEGIRGLTVDADGHVHACFKDGIYSVDKSTNTLKKLVDIDDAFGIAFDNRNNIIYSDATKLVRLNKDKTC